MSTTHAHLTDADLRNLVNVDQGDTPTAVNRYLTAPGPVTSPDRYHDALVMHAATYAADYAAAVNLVKAAADGDDATFRMASERMRAAHARYEVVRSIMGCATEPAS